MHILAQMRPVKTRIVSRSNSPDMPYQGSKNYLYMFKLQTGEKDDADADTSTKKVSFSFLFLSAAIRC